MNSLRGAQQTNQAERDHRLPEFSGKKKKKRKKRFAEVQIKLIHVKCFLVKSSSFAPAQSGVDDFGVSDINKQQLSATDVVS